MSSIFEKASRQKLRFTHKGQCNTEDLWDLSPTALNTIYQGLANEFKSASEPSLLDTKTTADTLVELKLEVVKHVFATKKAESNAKVLEKAKEDQKQKIKDIIARKKDNALEDMDLADLEKLLQTQ